MRVSEVYASVQGEGPRTGQTTVFTRFAGCNLRCPGWPCDTQHAIDPAYRGEWHSTNSDALVERVDKIGRMSGARVVTLTGGEPFIQREVELKEFVSGVRTKGYDVEAFTNGTIEYPEWATENVSMIMDWKLPGSGEDHENENRIANIYALNESSLYHSVKFVCKNDHDLNTAIALWSSLSVSVRNGLHWYYGRVWNGEISNAELVERVMRSQLPWRLNVQLHNYIWPPNERGR